MVATGLAHRFWELAEPAAQQANQMNHFLKNIAVIGGLLFYYVAAPGHGRWAAAASMPVLVRTRVRKLE